MAAPEEAPRYSANENGQNTAPVTADHFIFLKGDSETTRDKKMLSCHMSDEDDFNGDVVNAKDIIASAVTGTNPVRIFFKNVTYTIASKKKGDKYILRGLSGSIEPGTMTAIMGPTGSGKTSLLNVLANRMPKTKRATLTGTLLVNGLPVDKAANARRFSRLSAYVMQEDAMNALLTVRETIGLAAAFQLPPTVSEESKAKLVNIVISELGLNKVADTMVGSASVRGISGGEKKRANIGIELIKNPSALFLDEPTSGLDSFQAQSVMMCLGRLAAAGRTVVASIHQPRSSIYALFDQLYLISEGRTMYAGSAAGAVGYFAFVDPAFACPPLFNPADWFLDVTSADYRSKEKEVQSLARISTFERAWLAAAPLVSTSVTPEVSAADLAEADEALPTFQSSSFRQVQLVAWRSWVTVARDRAAIVSKVVPNLFMACVLGAIYSDVGDDQKSIQDTIGVLFFLTINQTFGNMFVVLNSFADEKVLVERERAAKSYRLSTFYFGKVVAELPMNLVSPLLFGCAVYWMVGLNPIATRFFIFLAVILLTGFAAIGLGMMVASIAPNALVAQAFAPIIVVLMILFGGFYINVDSLPDWLSWLQYLSIMRWAFMGLALNEFTGATFSCSDVHVDKGDLCIKTGEEVLAGLSFQDESVGSAVLALCIMIIGFNVLAYTALRSKKRAYEKLKAGRP